MTADLQEKIRARAFQIWQEEGHPQGRDFDHWLKAELEVNVKPAATKKAAPPKKAVTARAEAPKDVAAKAAAPKKAPAKKAAAPKVAPKAAKA
ncbi:MAG TPA: DUF2934 domain-containing protein [Candidatus Sulfotelmatobacter sp.]|jgi:hypothetical protein|nr:DUF2934 domain-containing protein [Candidatus Sulfotelmatobacter sp.]